MTFLSGQMVANFESFLLVMVRTTGLFVIAPIFGRQNVPAYLKVAFSFFVAAITFGSVGPALADRSPDLFTYALMVAKELVAGIALGYVSYLIITAIYMAGQMMDMQIGFGMVNVIDPMSNIQIPITSNLFFITCMIVFLQTGGHHILIVALHDSFRLIPLGGAAFTDDLLGDLIRLFGGSFALGFRIAAPMIAVIFIVNVVLGVITKTMPQLNVFVVGMPLKIIVGLAILVFVIPAFIGVLGGVISDTKEELTIFTRHMAAPT